AFGVSELTYLWAYAYVILVLAIGASFFLMRGAQVGGVSQARAAPPAAESAATATAPSWVDRLSWIGLAFVPAALVTAFTVHITTDVASAPLLWVFPLGPLSLTAPVGVPAAALSPHLRAGVPRPAADLARGTAVPAPRGASDRIGRPVVPDA